MEWDKKLMFTVPLIPPSYNKVFKINHRLRQIYLTPAARKFKDMVKLHMPFWNLPVNKIFIFDIKIEYYSKWKFKNKSIKKKDLQNLNKLLIDAVFDVLGRDDAFIWSIQEWKMPSANEDYYEKDMTIVTLEIIDEYEKK